ncbi:AIPR family protein [Mesorhizobium neociceri]|uniref:AIPR family protein n=1 Tax=Mesorhizobium neociceri TaxID=1307853 RepID=A0A838B6Y8_9HYPH|nr:AIPR family protein [Mesorhizobium neociceri]MBA1141842.1 AIPR family protein [Mesorhizobium neociceri]
MSYLDAFKANAGLIKQLGEGNAYLAWVMALYLEEPDVEALASEGITDGPNDKKIDFIYLDRDTKRIIFSQGYLSGTKIDAAPANKASDLNTAAAWLISGDLKSVPTTLREIIVECREAINDGEVEGIELLYVHNLPESVNVTRELQTAAQHLQKALGDSSISISARELGVSRIEHIFATQESHIDVKDIIHFPSDVKFSESGPKWEASVASVPGLWLHELYSKYEDRLFSANYRGFLGISRRRRINTGIRQSAETKPKDFWVFNNGITLLTLGKKETKSGIELTGISIINGAQTTGSLGSVDLKKSDIKSVNVLCRVIQCSDEDLGHTYVRKRGFRTAGDQIGIEEVAQPLLAFHGRYQDGIRGKNQIFERKPLYSNAFENKKARHILLAYSLARAIDERRIVLKEKSSAASIIKIEEDQLSLLRNLRFKSFLIAVVSQVLESITLKKVDPLTVAFQPDVAQAKNSSLVDLTAMWGPVVDHVLSLVSTQVTPSSLSENFSEDTFLPAVAKAVGALLYAGKAADQHAGFSKVIADS